MNIGIILHQELLYKFGIILLYALFSYLDKAFAQLQIIRQVHYRRAVSNVLIILLSCFPQLNRQRSHYIG